MHVSVGEGIAIAVFTGILVLASVNVRRQWRGERPPRGTSDRTLRTRPSVVVVGWLMLVGVALTIVGHAHTWHVPGTRAIAKCGKCLLGLGCVVWIGTSLRTGYADRSR